MNFKKGFTLPELLAVLSIIAILMLLASTSVVGVLNKQKETIAKDTEKKLKDAAIAYVQDQKIKLSKCKTSFNPESPDSSQRGCYEWILVSDIVDKGLFTDDANSCTRTAKILVYKENKTNYSELKAYAKEGICK